MKSNLLCSIGLGAPVLDEDELGADGCIIHATGLHEPTVCVHAHRFDVIQSKLCNVPFIPLLITQDFVPSPLWNQL